jgi:hypothetical protein
MDSFDGTGGVTPMGGMGGNIPMGGQMGMHMGQVSMGGQGMPINPMIGGGTSVGPPGGVMQHHQHHTHGRPMNMPYPDQNNPMMGGQQHIPTGYPYPNMEGEGEIPPMDTLTKKSKEKDDDEKKPQFLPTSLKEIGVIMACILVLGQPSVRKYLAHWLPMLEEERQNSLTGLLVFGGLVGASAVGINRYLLPNL